ncbi:MAG TPA: LTA synthase family protein [Puia sp.]|nr:LTA synthase family protein [Puia sp.]
MDSGPSFLLGLRFDIRDVCLLMLILLILGSIPNFNPFQSSIAKRCSFLIISLAALILMLFYIVDFAYYSYLSQRLNANVLNFFQDAAISARMVWQTYPVIQILLGLVAGTWFLNWLTRKIFNRIKKTRAVSSRKSRVAWFVGCFLFFSAGMFGRLSQYPLRWSDAFTLGSEYKASLSLNPFESFFNTLDFIGDRYDVNSVKKAYHVVQPYYFGLDSAKANQLNFDRVINARPGGLKTNPNVVIVICESFAAYRSSAFNNPISTTPFFDSMCKKGILFDHCFSPGFGTARGVWSVVTGIPDISSSTLSRNPSAVNQHTIINDFQGYDKFYFIGGSTSWANIRGLLKNNIDSLRLFEQEDYENKAIDVWGVSDKNLLLNASTILAQEKGPFIAVIQTADNHRPYTIPKEDEQAFHRINVSDDSLRISGFKSNDELNAYRYTDFCFERFMAAASEKKYFDNTIFLFVGDHGIPGNAGSIFPKAWSEQGLTTEHIPLLIYAPKLISPGRISDCCSQIDVLPTVAGLCNLSYNNTTLGRDLLDSAHIAGKHFAFIYGDYVGIVQGSLFFRRQIKTGKEELVSIVNNDDYSKDEKFSKTKNEMRILADSFLEVSKYIAFNNKKKY